MVVWIYKITWTANVPLVAEQYENAHGVFIGSAVASEVTAAALDAKVGSLRHDPMAMLPFCGYHMADYWSHWLEMQEKLGDKFPKVYQVNWFRKDENGKFIWPGYGDNSRVLDWIVRRASGEVHPHTNLQIHHSSIREQLRKESFDTFHIPGRR